MVTTTTERRRALVVVDVQNDFCEGGSLAVDGGAHVAASITDFVRAERSRYAQVIATRDLHIDPGEHFASGEPDYIDTWPAHCVAGTPGADFHPDLSIPLDVIVSKGQYAAAYSGFEGAEDAEGVTLVDWLRRRGVTDLDVVGIATSHCVRATALDGVAAGFDVRLLADLCVGVTAELADRAIDEMAAAGVEITTSAGLGEPAPDGPAT